MAGIIQEFAKAASMRPGANRRDHDERNLLTVDTVLLASMRSGANRRDHVTGVCVDSSSHGLLQ